MSICQHKKIQIMKIKYSDLLKTIKINVHRNKLKSAIKPLKDHSNETVNLIGDALIETIDHIITPEEKQIFSIIENRRSFLLNSDLVIECIDFGAGNPHSNRPIDQMKEGLRSTTSISKICKASKSKFWVLIIFKLIRKLKPSSCIELGTCLGISASYQAAALTLNKKGRLVTLEGSPESCRVAKETLDINKFKNTEVICGPFDDTFISALSSLQPVDFLFNDGHHDHDAVIKYFDDAIPYLADDAIILFDDISWSQGMRKAWKEIEDDERISVTIDLGAMGIAFLSNRIVEKTKFSIPL